MPGPFPGMDPFIESAGLWPSFHGLLAGQITAQLNRDLPPGYVALFGERTYILPHPRDFIGDIAVRRRPAPEPVGAVITVAPPASASEPTGTARLSPMEAREYYVEILLRGSEAQAVTVIEILSPVNKSSAQQHGAYLRKQATILESETNLVEIDLLRGGEHTVAVPASELDAYGAYDYIACIHRAARRYEFDFWLYRLLEPLTPVRIPLSPNDPEATLDLQAVCDAAYDAGGYSRLLDYQSDLKPPPRPEVSQRIREFLQH